MTLSSDRSSNYGSCETGGEKRIHLGNFDSRNLRKETTLKSKCTAGLIPQSPGSVVGNVREPMLVWIGFMLVRTGISGELL